MGGDGDVDDASKSDEARAPDLLDLFLRLARADAEEESDIGKLLQTLQFIRCPGEDGRGSVPIEAVLSLVASLEVRLQMQRVLTAQQDSDKKKEINSSMEQQTSKELSVMNSRRDTASLIAVDSAPGCDSRKTVETESEDSGNASEHPVEDDVDRIALLDKVFMLDEFHRSTTDMTSSQPYTCQEIFTVLAHQIFEMLMEQEQQQAEENGDEVDQLEKEERIMAIRMVVNRTTSNLPSKTPDCQKLAGL